MAVERVSSTSFQINKERPKHVFATYETRRRFESDNGVPFNSIERFVTPQSEAATPRSEWRSCTIYLDVSMRGQVK